MLYKDSQVEFLTFFSSGIAIAQSRNEKKKKVKNRSTEIRMQKYVEIHCRNVYMKNWMVILYSLQTMFVNIDENS